MEGLAAQCMAFCTSLADRGLPFTFNITMDTFTFTLDTRERETEGTRVTKKIKKK